MKLYQLKVQKDEAWNVMNQFGELGKAQFVELNKDEAPHSLPFTKQVKQCEEAERKLQFILDQCKKHYVQVTPPDNIDGFLNQLQKIDAPVELCVTLNRTHEVDPAKVLARIDYAHPVFDGEAIAAQSLHDRISGRDRTHYCGAYWGHGFHEDGVQSALRVLEGFGAGLDP